MNKFLEFILSFLKIRQVVKENKESSKTVVKDVEKFKIDKAATKYNLLFKKKGDPHNILGCYGINPANFFDAVETFHVANFNKFGCWGSLLSNECQEQGENHMLKRRLIFCAFKKKAGNIYELVRTEDQAGSCYNAHIGEEYVNANAVIIFHVKGVGPDVTPGLVLGRSNFYEVRYADY